MNDFEAGRAVVGEPSKLRRTEGRRRRRTVVPLSGAVSTVSWIEPAADVTWIERITGAVLWLPLSSVTIRPRVCVPGVS